MQSFRRKILTLACVAAASASQAKELGQFAPPNSRRIPESTHTLEQRGGLTKAEFDAVLDKVKAYYGPVIKKKGGSLHINRAWSDDTVNASAQRILWFYVVNMYGGLARYPTMTPDGFMFVACHETGHHIGGATKIDGSWASNEGQSDYFAALQCFRNLVGSEDHVAFMQGKAVHPIVAASCSHVYSGAQERALCERSAMAGQILADMLGDLGGTGPTNFATPDKTEVSETLDSHPNAQCRLDTYLAGSLCTESPTAPLSDKDPNVGTCHIGDGRDFGHRPRCWYAPEYVPPGSRRKVSLGGVHY